VVLVPPLWVRRRPRLTGGLGGGRRFLSLSAAGWRRWFKSEDAAEHLRSPLRRNFGETAEDGAPRRRREPLSLRLLAEVPRDADPPLVPWFHAPRFRGRGGWPESKTHQERPMCAFWQLAETPGGDAVEKEPKTIQSPSGTAAGSC
jgi:hypothetical protein